MKVVDGGGRGGSHQQSMQGTEVCARVEVFLQDILHWLVLTQNLQEEMMVMMKKKIVEVLDNLETSHFQVCVPLLD